VSSRKKTALKNFQEKAIRKQASNATAQIGNSAYTGLDSANLVSFYNSNMLEEIIANKNANGQANS